MAKCCTDGIVCVCDVRTCDCDCEGCWCEDNEADTPEEKRLRDALKGDAAKRRTDPNALDKIRARTRKNKGK